MKNSKEYNQLKSLLDSDILTKNEFENKIILLKESIKNSTINKENNFVESLNNQTVNRETTDNQILKIVSKIILIILMLYVYYSQRLILQFLDRKLVLLRFYQ